MNIAIVGYGKMGHEVERLVARSDHDVHGIHLKRTGTKIDASALSGADVAIDFSGAEIVTKNIQLYCDLKIPAVIGTTGWNSRDPAIIKLVEDSSTCIIVGSNFSTGVQIFLQVLRMAARQISRVEGYDVYGIETHHRLKADSPSGTARAIAENLIANFDQKTDVSYEAQHGAIARGTLHISSVRGGVNAGRHEVIFDSEADQISLTHQAHNRSGFAEGAIRAAEYAVTQSGYIFYEELFEKGGPYEPTI